MNQAQHYGFVAITNVASGAHNDMEQSDIFGVQK